MPAVLPAIGAFFATEAGAATAAGLTSAAVGAGASALLSKGPGNISIPPPPGAAMVDPAGSTAAAATRRRQAVAGGLDSTIGAAPNQASPTGGSKQLLGQ